MLIEVQTKPGERATESTVENVDMQEINNPIDTPHIANHVVENVSQNNAVAGAEVIVSTNNTTVSDVRVNEIYDYTMASHNSGVDTNMRYNHRIRGNLDQASSHQQFDVSMMEMFATRGERNDRDNGHPISDLVMENSQQNINNVMNLLVEDNVAGNLRNQLPVFNPSIEHFGQTPYGVYPFVYSAAVNQNITDNFGNYSEGYVDDRRRINSMVDSFMADRNRYFM